MNSAVSDKDSSNGTTAFCKAVAWWNSNSQRKKKIVAGVLHRQKYASTQAKALRS